MLALLREVSLRHLVHAPIRSLLVLFGIALGVAMLVATTAVNASLLGSFTEMVGRVAGRADVVVTNGEIGVGAELVEQIAEVKGVAHVAGSLEVVTRRTAGGGPLLVLGVDFLGDQHFLPFEPTAEGGGEDVVEDPLTFVNDPTAILVANKLAKNDGLSVGSKIELLTSEGPKSFTVRGVLEDEGPTASFGGQVAVMFSEAAQVMFARQDRYDRIDVAIAEGVELEAVLPALKSLVGARGRVEKPEGRAAHLGAILGPFETGLTVAGLVALLVGMFLIYNAVGVSVAQRRREIGLLRALGVSRSRVVALFCLEALILALLGGALGLLLGNGLAKIALDQTAPNVSKLYGAIRPGPPQITVDLAMKAFLAAIVTTLAAAYWPARRAARIDPVESLRRSRGTISAHHIAHRTLLVVSGVVLAVAIAAAYADTGAVWTGLTAMGLTVLAFVLAVPAFVLGLRRIVVGPIEKVFGIPGRLAVDNVERSLERSGLTVAALMVSVGSSVCIASWGRSLEDSILSWLDQSVPADIFVTAGSPFADQHNVPFKPEAAEKLMDLPAVTSVQRVRIVNQELNDIRIQLLSLDSHLYYSEIAARGIKQMVVAGKAPIEPGEISAEPLIVLSQGAANRLGLNPGDKVDFDTPTGARTFTVRAVVVDYTSDLGTGLIDRKYFVEYWGDQLIDTIDVYLKEGAPVEATVAEIRRRLGDNAALFVTPAAQLREEIRRVVLSSISVLKSTDLVTLMVALLGVIGTMLAAVLDRIREIGILRAVGATRRQIAAAVIAESGFLGFASSLAGVVLGIPMGLVFVRVVALAATGWRVDYSFPIEVAARIAITVAITAALAGLFPGRRAARMDVTEALAYE